MEVLVNNDLLSLVGAGLSQKIDCEVEQRALERPSHPLPPLRQLDRPSRRLVLQPTEVVGTRSAPELP
jgi:hypothetical protein